MKGFNMHCVNSALWAKKTDHNGILQWLPLSVHLEDTGNVAGMLWEHWLSENQRIFIQSHLSQACEPRSFVQLLGCIHDIGKATPVFQARPSYTNSNDLDSMLVTKLEQAGFQGLSDFVATTKDWSKSHHTITGQGILTHLKVPCGICAIVGAHHGKPLDKSSIYEEDYHAYSDHYLQFEEPARTPEQQRVMCLWQQTQQDILSWALEKTGFSNVAALPDISESVQVLLSGLVIMADWIASNEQFFPLVSLDADVDFDIQQRLCDGWGKWQSFGSKDVWTTTNSAFDVPTLFMNRFGFSPNVVQKALCNAISSCGKPGIFILESAMGSGKTEASLAAVELLSAKTGKSGLFFGLPTQATSNGMFSRIKDWLQHVNDDFQGKLGLRLVHGKAELNKEYQKLPHAVHLNNGNEEQELTHLSSNYLFGGTLLINDWFTGRKTAMLDDFVVGTVDQFLLTSLKQKHLMLRHLGFSKKVIIIDEVHAYDTYMNQFLEMSLSWMAAYNVPVVLLSATLPANRRKVLLQAYLKGMGTSWKKCNTAQCDLTTDAYPLLTYTDIGVDQAHNQQIQVKQDKIKLPSTNSVKITVKHCMDDDAYAAVLQALHASIDGGGVAGIIVNTVKRAQELYALCAEHFGAQQVLLIHSKFVATDRIRKEEEIVSLIGKGARRPFQKIIIGTQVLEQSLDIDFDVLFSDLAPIDLLLQRIGRLHRHTIKRPVHLATPTVYVVVASQSYEFDSGSEAIYGRYILMRTQYFLPDVITMPGDISKLVQEVYALDDNSSNNIQLPSDIESTYKRAQQNFESRNEDEENNAKVYRLKKPHNEIGKYSMVGWLADDVPNQSDEFARAQVRNSGESIEIIALCKVDDGYGTFAERINVKNDIASSSVAMKLARETVQLPAFFSRNAKITEDVIEQLEIYRREKLPEWDNQPWLHDCLALIFDQNNNCHLNSYKLTYSSSIGLSYEKAETNE